MNYKLYILLIDVSGSVSDYTNFINTYINTIYKIANDNDSLLILDEIVSGFRFDLGGCQKFFNIKGDMTCFGKGMGNGLAISAITGAEEFMKAFDDLWVSSTNNAETLSMAGTVAVINEMKEKNTIRQCWSTGKRLFDEWNKITKSHELDVKMNGYPIRMKLDCYDSKENENEYLKSLVLQEMIKKGIFFSPGVSFISYSHTSEDIELTLNALEDVCKEIKKNVIDDKYEKLLKGNMPKTIWSMKINPTKRHD